MKWNTLAVIVNVMVQILRISVLARFLDREDFGMIAIALMVVSFTEIFADLGFTVPLIHKQNISKEEYSSVFWTNNALSFVIFGIIIAIAPLVAKIYETPGLIPVVRALAVVVVLNALGKMFQTIKQKNLDYKFMSMVSIVSNIIGFVAMILFAVMGYGIWSLVWGTIIQTGIRQGIYFFEGIKNSRISFYCSLNKITDFIRIGGYQVGSQILDFFAGKIDIMLLGIAVGMDNLGTYNLAKELIQKCYGFSNSLTRGVMTAAFAKIQDNVEIAKDRFLQFCKVNSLVFVPVFALIFLLADDISKMMYGDKWDSIYKVLAILSIYGAFQTVISPCATVLMSFGKTDKTLIWTFIQAIISATIILIVGHWGFMPIVYAQIPISIIFVFLCWGVMIKRLLPIKLNVFIINTCTPIFASTVIIALVLFGLNFVTDNTFTSIISGLIFIIGYIGFVFYREPQILQQVKKTINK